MIHCRRVPFFLILYLLAASVFAADSRPNIVLVFMDNFGWGELGVYGGGVLRGAATPRIDSIATEGMRLLNFNVEAQCTPSRAAIMTGRYAIRTGNASVPLGVGEYGLTQWEYTIAEMLSDAGYSTGMFGKWHLGDSSGRYPTDQGFDEWYGIPNSSDESYWPDNDLFREDVHPQVKYEYVMEAVRGKKPKQLELYDSARRLTIDRDITGRSIDFMKRRANQDNPFFLFIPYTQTHLPVEPHPDNKGKTGNGHWADVLAQTDAYVGELLDAVDDLGISNDTIFIFTADNGPEGVIPHQGFSGPWRGSYFTGLEGSLRVPFLIRWPGNVPKSAVSNEIIHEMDLFSTFARIGGGEVPRDRVMDSVDQTEFLTGQSLKSSRESVVVYVGQELYGVKWRNWKMMVKEIDTIAGDPTRSYGVPLFYNLLLDPKEEHPALNAPTRWAKYPPSWTMMWLLPKLRRFCAYLADKFPAKGYAPEVSSNQRGRYYRYLFYPGTTLEPMFTFNQMEVTNYSPQSTGWGDLERCMAAVESMTPEDDWAMGTQFTAADVIFGGMLDFSIQFGWLKSPTPKVAAYVRRIKNRSAYRESHDPSWH